MLLQQWSEKQNLLIQNIHSYQYLHDRHKYCQQFSIIYNHNQIVKSLLLPLTNNSTMLLLERGPLPMWSNTYGISLDFPPLSDHYTADVIQHAFVVKY